jgi:hypothetical protein
MGVNLASFPNSRISPTPATSAAVQEVYTALPNTTPDPQAVLIPANPNRTYLTVYNRHPTDSCKFMNYSGSGPIPTASSIETEGFELIAGAAYEIDTPEATYALSTTVNPIPLDTDEGSG